jgi:uncharacterized membrane protein YhhN
MIAKKFWLYFFLVVLITHLAGTLLLNAALQYISKPLLIISLTAYFVSNTKEYSNRFKRWVLPALSFSWLGDVLLMFQANNELFFLSGLCAFLLAHIFYIIFFHRVRVSEAIKGRWWLLLIVGAYYAFLITFLSPYLGDMKLPVRVYGIVISFMLLLAVHLSPVKNKKAGLFMMTGAVLFVISDSALAVNKFYQSFEPAGFIVMLTYGMAQLFITEGAIRYIRSNK